MPSANAPKKAVNGIEVYRVERISEVLSYLMSRDLEGLRRDYQVGQLNENMTRDRTRSLCLPDGLAMQKIRRSWSQMR